MIKWESSTVAALEAAIKQKAIQFLHAGGSHAVNQMAEYAHVRTGALKTSINYKVDPANMKAEVGTNIIYAGPQEKHNAFASRTYDKLATDGQLLRIAEKVFKLD